MSQNVTNPHTSPAATPPDASPSPLPPPLSPRQFAALPLIVAGLPDADVAARLNVARETVNRWRCRNPAFIAALNAHRQQRHAASADRYDRLLNRAMDIIEAVQNSAAFDIYQKVRLANSLLSAGRRTLTAPPGPTNPADILQALLHQGLPPDSTPDETPSP